jgi:DNA mismatch repair ATPase MutS
VRRADPRRRILSRPADQGGHRVAIAEQIESPAEAKKRGSKAVVNRAIVRVSPPAR